MKAATAIADLELNGKLTQLAQNFLGCFTQRAWIDVNVDVIQVAYRLKCASARTLLQYSDTPKNAAPWHIPPLHKGRNCRRVVSDQLRNASGLFRIRQRAQINRHGGFPRTGGRAGVGIRADTS